MSRDDHLDSNRIRQMAALRRAAIRTRSYCVIALGVCVVAIAQFVFEMIHEWPVPFAWRGIWLPILYLICAALLAALAIPFLVRRFVRYHREAQQSAMPPPASPPDFSQLQDGSQIVRNLEDM